MYKFTQEFSNKTRKFTYYSGGVAPDVTGRKSFKIRKEKSGQVCLDLYGRKNESRLKKKKDVVNCRKFYNILTVQHIKREGNGVFPSLETNRGTKCFSRILSRTVYRQLTVSCFLKQLTYLTLNRINNHVLLSNVNLLYQQSNSSAKGDFRKQESRIYTGRLFFPRLLIYHIIVYNDSFL